VVIVVWFNPGVKIKSKKFYLKKGSVKSFRYNSIENLTLKTGYSLQIFFKMPPEIIKFILPDYNRARRRQTLSGGNILPQRWKWGAGVVETYSRAVEIYSPGGGNGVPERWKNEKLPI
jgi:hypothetical protein